MNVITVSFYYSPSVFSLLFLCIPNYILQLIFYNQIVKFPSHPIVKGYINLVK